MKIKLKIKYMYTTFKWILRPKGYIKTDLVNLANCEDKKPRLGNFVLLLWLSCRSGSL